MSKALTTNPSDIIREKILKYLYDTHKNAISVQRARVTDAMVYHAVQGEVEQKGQIVSNLLYLVQAGWVKKETESYSIPEAAYGTTRTKTVRGKTTYYLISDKGINHFEGASKFEKSSWTPGINITNVQGVTVIGDNNYVRYEYNELYRGLELLGDEVRKTPNLSDEDKIKFLAEIGTIKSQLAKPNPTRDIVRAAWNALSALATVEGVVQLYERLAQLVAPLLQ